MRILKMIYNIVNIFFFFLFRIVVRIFNTDYLNVLFRDVSYFRFNIEFCRDTDERVCFGQIGCEIYAKHERRNYDY